MICPRCGDELRRSKKDPSYGLCDNCRKKYKWVEEEIDDEIDDEYDDEIDDDDDDDDDVDVDEDIKNPGKSVKGAPRAANKKKKGGVLKILIILLIILVIAGVAAYIVFFTDLINLGGNKDKGTQQQVQQEDTDTTQDDTADDTDKSPNSEGAYESNTYLVGTEIPAGEYVIISEMSGYFARTVDTTGDDGTITANGNFTTNTIVTVYDGEYLTFSNSVAYPIDQAPALDTTREGMFKVGKDIEAGEYNIHTDSNGYYEVASDSNHVTENIVNNMYFEGDQTITVEDGQYLTLTNAVIVN